MGKLVVSEFITLNGVIEAPETWAMDYHDEEIMALKLAELMASDALLLGRTTYDVFAGTWPDRTDEAGFADKINSMPKYVVTSGDPAPWRNTTVIGADLAERVAALKAETSGDVLVNGSGQLVNALLAAGLVDELTLVVYPVVRASGQRLFEDGTAALLKLVESRPFASGPVLTTYAVRQGGQR